MAVTSSVTVANWILTEVMSQLALDPLRGKYVVLPFMNQASIAGASTKVRKIRKKNALAAAVDDTEALAFSNPATFSVQSNISITPTTKVQGVQLSSDSIELALPTGYDRAAVLSAIQSGNPAALPLVRDAMTEILEAHYLRAETDAAIETRVAAILDDVRQRGDAAVLEYTHRFDGLQAASLGELEIGPDELARALQQITPAQRSALQQAAARVRAYHERQLEACGKSWQYRDADGTLLGQKVTPLDRVGIYVPGGKAAYPSSVLMNAIPAQVAGVGEIVMVVPTPRGERNALVLAAAQVAGEIGRAHV